LKIYIVFLLVLYPNLVLWVTEPADRKTYAVLYCRKRYDKAEQEFLDAKLLLFERLERKELLTEHLCTIIEQNEMRKGRKLSELMDRLQLGGCEEDQKTAARNMVSCINPCQVK
jgi:hypothetical protein